MSCFEVNRIETALGEIEALNILRAQEKLPSFFPSRRPYLSRNQREIVAKLSQTSLERYFLPGESIHVPMLPEEKMIIVHIFHFKGKRLSASDFSSISE